MTDIAINVENIGKSYLLGHNTNRSEGYTSLRDVIANNAKGAIRKTRDMLKGKPIIQGDEIEEFHALKDINFEIKQGDRVGIIGGNGAGKSTLLKILSRITEPTSGRITINGRVASLLEVGTGFHPELTGRENIFLNGAILGMSRYEIKRKFDEIVAFSEVEQFLDTPVKRYSSGMYVRLAFAVAAHLEPEILVVDEVLAVGDAQFQKKCLGKMEEVSTQGRTILFVSHQLGSVQSLCNRAIHLRKGKLIDDGDAEVVIQRYLTGLVSSNSSNPFSPDNPDRNITGNAWFTDGYLLNADGKTTNSVIAGEDIRVVFHYESKSEIKDLYITLTIFNSSGVAVTNIHTELMQHKRIDYPQRGIAECTIPRLPLSIGEYRIAVALSVLGQQQDLVRSAIQFSVIDSTFFGSSLVPPNAYCMFYIDHSWQITTN